MNFLEMYCLGLVIATGISLIAIKNVEPMVLLIAFVTTLLIGLLIQMYSNMFAKAKAKKTPQGRKV